MITTLAPDGHPLAESHVLTRKEERSRNAVTSSPFNLTKCILELTHQASGGLLPKRGVGFPHPDPRHSERVEQPGRGEGTPDERRRRHAGLQREIRGSVNDLLDDCW